jgi:crossover junction endodeoxyribonuclease RusA
MTEPITFTVPGKPATQGDHKGFYNPKTKRVHITEKSTQVGPWRARVALAANLAWGSRDLLHDVPVAVTIEFVLLRPTGTAKSRPTPPAVKKNADIDKLTRGILDGITHTIVADDGAVIALHATKRIAEIGESPGAIITVEEIAWPISR